MYTDTHTHKKKKKIHTQKETRAEVTGSKQSGKKHMGLFINEGKIVSLTVILEEIGVSVHSLSQSRFLR